MHRHEQLGLSDEQAVSMYRHMVLARTLDERMWHLNRTGKIPFAVSCQGQEGAQVGAGFALDPARDFIAPYYRDLGIVLVFGQTAREVALSSFARAQDPSSGGRQMPAHYSSREKHILSGSSPVATQIPHAVGLALGARLRGKNAVVYTSFGEGSSNQGDFHEGCNFAGVHKLPVVFFCENNRYAISIPLDKQLGCERVADRAAGYGFPGVTVDGNDVLGVYDAMRTAVKRALDGAGPTLVEVMTYRLTPHSSDDDDRAYRSREEVEDARARDALVVFRQYLEQAGLMSDEQYEVMRADVQAEVDEAVRYAEQAAYPEPQSALLHVFAQP